MLKLLHIADIHIGAKFTFLGEAAAAHRERIMHTFERSVDLALAEEVDVVLICGDVFDDPYPGRLAQAQVSKLLAKLAEKSISVIILPGNHDRLEEGSVWDDFDGPDNLHILRTVAGRGEREAEGAVGAISSLHLPELKLGVVARPVLTQKSQVSPLQGLKEKITNLREEHGSDTYVVAMAHGSVELAKSAENFPIAKAEIADLGADYLALGDWHGFLDASQGEQKAFYPGSLEFLNSSQENAGNALVVSLGSGSKAEPKKHKVSELGLKSVNYNLDQVKFDDVIKEVAALASDKLILNVKITGSASIDIGFEEDFAELQGKFYFLKIEDRSESIFKSTNPADYPENSIPHQFIQAVSAAKDKGDLKEDIAEDVLKLGLQAILRGGEDD